MALMWWLVVFLASSGVLAQFPSLVTQNVLPPISPIVTNHKCKNDTLLYLQHLKNHTLWAVKMYDSSAKIPVGLLAGSTFQMGHFDECLQIGSEEAPTEVVPMSAPVRAQYCLARIQISPLVNTYPDFAQQNVPHAFSLQYDPRGSMWEKFRVPIDPSKKRRDVFYYAVCLPASCGLLDVRDGLLTMLQPLAKEQGAQLEVDVEEKYCQTAEEEPFTIGDVIFLAVVGATMFLVAICSSYDLWTYKKRNQQDPKSITRPQKVIIAMSVFSNLEKLNKPDVTDEMGVLHGMRLYSMIFIILGHRCFRTYGGPLFNPEFLEERYRHFQDMFLFNGAIVVDTFYVMSAFLATYSMLQTLNKSGSLNLTRLYIHRWLRLTPVYMMMVFFYATLLDNMGSGPIWKSRISQERDPCLNSWWTNFLYINNYVNADKVCMFQSWYLASDMHFYLLAPLFVIPLYKKPILGMIALVTALVVSVIVPFLVTYTGSYNAVLRFYMTFLENPVSNPDFYVLYEKSHNRASPYIIGIITAYIYRKMKLKKTTLPNSVVIPMTGVALCLGFSSLLGAYVFFIPGREYSALENAIYNPLHRIGWSLAMSWTILIACTGNFNSLWPLNPLMKIHAFIPLSRLTYCAYLTHAVMQLFTLGTMRQPEYMDMYKFMWMVAGDLTITFIFALVLHLLFEAPVTEIKKLFWVTPPAKPTSNNNQSLTTLSDTRVSEISLGPSNRY